MPEQIITTRGFKWESLNSTTFGAEILDRVSWSKEEMFKSVVVDYELPNEKVPSFLE